MAPAKDPIKEHVQHVAARFGAPPESLNDIKGPIPDFFKAAPFQPVLDARFLSKFAGTQPEWGPVGYVVYKRTYARPLTVSDLGLELQDLGEWTDEEGIVHHDYHPYPSYDHVVRSEEFWESLTRVVNGLWHILRCHSARKNIDFSEETARRKARHMFQRMWSFKWLPPGRGLWMMGTFQMYAKGSAALNNCGFVSTINIDKEFAEAFGWAMDMSMLGVGIGFDTRGANKIAPKLPFNLENWNGEGDPYITKSRVYKLATVDLPPRRISGGVLPADQHPESLADYQQRIRQELAWAVPAATAHTSYEMVLDEEFLVDKLYLKKTFTTLNPSDQLVFQIPDSREGWVDSVIMVIDAFLKGDTLPVFDYSLIRPKGAPIRGFGGTAEGPEHLEICHQDLVAFFLDRIGKLLDGGDITDIFNAIGACVVSGNVRRSAQIGLGDPTDESFISLKHDPINHPNSWNSNNSVLGQVGMNYDRIGELIATRGEPGVFWVENARDFGRMGEPADKREKNVMGVNPCAEQTLHNYELCCLVENFPTAHDDAKDFTVTLKQSYLYAKTVTLVPSHSKRTNAVMGRNSRIGCSMSGIQQARRKFGTRRFLEDFADAGYHFIKDLDENYSEWLQVKTSIKHTSVKPSGTIGKLPGASPGIHDFIEDVYLQRIRFAKTNYMVPILKAAGYRVYDAPEQPDTTCIIDFPVQEKFVFRTERQSAESIMEQLEFVAQFQKLWADNSVSVTVKFHQHSAACRARTKALREINLLMQSSNVRGFGDTAECDCLAERGREIAQALELYETRLKAVSFLPYYEQSETEDGPYKAMPYKAISLERYQEEIKHLQPYTLNEVSDDIYSEDCGAACPVR